MSRRVFADAGYQLIQPLGLRVSRSSRAPQSISAASARVRPSFRASAPSALVRSTPTVSRLTAAWTAQAGADARSLKSVGVASVIWSIRLSRTEASARVIVASGWKTTPSLLSEPCTTPDFRAADT